MNVKQVIVMRKKYDKPDGSRKKLRTGKMVAQGAHASMKAILDMMEDFIIDGNDTNPYGYSIFGIEDMSPQLESWINGRFTKICVTVDTEDEMQDLLDKAKDQNLPNAKIIDAGLTEFDNVPTFTCIAIGPAEAEVIDKITGHLPLL